MMKKIISALVCICIVISMYVPTYAGTTSEETTVSDGVKISELFTDNQMNIAHEQFYNIEDATLWLRKQMVDRKKNIKFSIISKEPVEVEKIMSIVYQHTGNADEGDYLFWQSRGTSLDYYTKQYDDEIEYDVSVDAVYTTTKEEEEYVDNAISRIIEGMDLEEADDFNKIKSIYAYICNNISYDYDNTEQDYNNIAHSAYAALKYGKCVCDGYALLIYNMMLKCGIDCRVISGTAGCFIEHFENYEAHAWNIVKLGDYYYNLDSTWDAGETYFSYFLCSDNSFNSVSKGHRRDEEFLSEEFLNKFPVALEDYVYYEQIQGSCGENGSEVIWSINNGILKISGTGNMDSYLLLETPWEEYKNLVKRIIIEEGVQSVSSYAFYSFINIKDVKLPESLNYIGSGAFADCENLESINIPSNIRNLGGDIFSCCYSLKSVTFSEGVTEISDGMFSGADKLEKIIIPESVEKIGAYAFSSCMSLRDINLGENIKYIGEEAFSGTGISEICIPKNVNYVGGGVFSGTDIQSISVSEENKYYCDIDGVLFNKDKTTLISYPAGRMNSKYTIPEGIVNIEDYAFEHSWNLFEVELTEGIKTIGYRAFSSCRITGYVFPKSLQLVKSEAFLNNSGLTEITIPQGVEFQEHVFGGCSFSEVKIEDGVKEIPKDFFSSSNLNNIVIPQSVYEIGYGAFAFCNKLEKITISDNVREIGSIAFWNCDNLKEIELGTNIAYIGSQAFDGCTSLSDVYFEGTEKKWNNIDFSEMNELLKNSHIHCYGAEVNLDVGMEQVKCAGMNVSLLDEISDMGVGINYYLDIPAEIENNVKVYIGTANTGMEPIDLGKIKIVESKLICYDNNKMLLNTYCISYNYAAAMMNDKVNLVVMDSNDNIIFKTEKSVVDYAKTILDDNTGKYDQYKNLVKAMLNYGASAQKFFVYEEDSLANDCLDGADKNFDAINEEDLSKYELSNLFHINTQNGEINYWGSSIILNSKLTIRHYFTLDPKIDSSVISIEVGGDYFPLNKNGGLYYIDIPDISINNIARTYGIKMHYDGRTYILNYSVMNYICKGVKNNSTKEICTMLYNCYELFSFYRNQ